MSRDVAVVPKTRALQRALQPRELVLTFDRAVCDAEEMIRRATSVLYQHQARISAVNKGRGLEQRVMELTE